MSYENLHLKHRLHEAASAMRERHARYAARTDSAVDVIVAVAAAVILGFVCVLGGFE